MGGWVVAIAREKKLNDRDYDIHKYPQKSSIPLQSLNRHTLTVAVISVLHGRFRALRWHHFANCEFTWSAKSSPEKQTS